MNILELDSFSLDDAVKFHTRLNPRIWGKDEHLLPEVKQKLLAIARDFQEFLGVPDLDVKDITISGSNAAYTYTPHSDIDLHLVVAMPESHNEVYQELFNAKKYQYNDEHNIVIGGADVELYVQLSSESPVSQGEYSVPNDQWIQVPRRKKHSIDDTCVRAKVEDLDARIQQAIDSGNADRMKSLWTKIKTMRQTGLDQHGEFGCENIAFKILRKHGVLKNLKAALNSARDQELSLQERKKKKPRVRYGFGGYWYPGFAYGGESGEGGGDGGGESMREGHYGSSLSSEDGVAPSTQLFLNEEPDTESIINQFIQHTADRLGIESMPKVNIHRDPDWSIENHSFGQFRPDTNELDITVPGRHLLDILRTVAHELTHCRQNELEQLPLEAGETGSHWENEAHAAAGIIMRDFADAHPGLFDSADLQESASGYIPTKKQAKDPRYAMALTVDIKPGQVGKEANKMGLKTDSQGRPALLMKTANTLAESLAEDFKKFNKSKGKEEPWDRDGYEPPGPEFPPQMPAGTTKIDVTDLTDWYRLGQDISDMDDADPEDYNQGPPQTVITFASDELEQAYLKQFKRLGLKTHDIDPDVEGGEDLTGKHLHKELAEEFELLEQEFLGEIKMTGKNLAKLAQDIKGAKVGLEFEMIVPNVSNDEDSEQEPDYDQDERVRDIDDAVRFFDDGDYNSSREIRRLREQMESDYFDWQSEQIDQDWQNNGFEFFQEYLDREEPFDPEDYQDRAEDEIKTEFPDLDPTSEDFEELVAEKLREINAEYYVEQWEAQGRNYDYAQEEFSDEKRDEYSESDWLSDRGIRYASDVQNEYSDVQWPYWTSTGDSEGDIETVALDFMNAMGMDSVAISSSYHGSYKKWVGNGWVSIGNNKPDDCFTIEPDGSLEGDNDSDTGLEFVSPPIPLEDIGTVMSKVQNWAGTYGAYTSGQNKTSIHTNISIPGYNLDNLDYLKAALLLGDEYVLREFDRIGNTYAAPAIEKVRTLVKQNPEKAQALLDKMKSQLNAEASKLIHSGQTNKFTSINTKDNRVEFRSPGGDYLSIIADNPQKMVDTINRMVVTLDAAMDPSKYKEEYQKKLYKMLTGQQSGREAASGKKQEMKKDDKDLLNIFSRYAAGELPKAALKSFVRQAQLERKVAKGKETGKMWWNVQWDNNRRIEVVADSKEVAKQVAAEEWGVPESQLAVAVVTPLRPYEEKPAAQQPAQQPAAQNQEGNWGIWIDANNRFANQPGEYARGETPPLIRFPSRAAAELWVEQQRAARPNMRADIEVREIAPAEPVPGSTLDLQRQRAAAADTNNLRPTGPGPWEVANRNNNQVYYNPGHTQRAAAETEARTWLTQNGHNPADFEVRTREGVRSTDAAQGGIVDVADEQPAQAPRTLTRPGQGQQVFTGEWKVLLPTGEEVYRFSGVGNSQSDANRVAASWLRQNGYGVSGEGFEVLPVMG